MPSIAAIQFTSRQTDLAFLRSIAIDSRLKPIADTQKQIFLHSYLTGVVASWDAYIKAVIKEYLGLITQPTDIRYHSIYTLLHKYASTSIEKLNTPNFDNTRNILISTTGYDPIGDCVWTPRGFSAIATRDRLNEILKVRHSYAHGFMMPSYSWNRTPTGHVRLTTTAVDDCKSLITFLVKQYDKGLNNIMISNHSITSGW